MNMANEQIDTTRNFGSKYPWPILIADDHGLVRDALSDYLRRTGDYEVDVVESLSEAEKALANGKRYEIALIDLIMPGMDGISSVEKIVHDFPDTKIVVISGNASLALMRRTISVGGMGFFPKTLSMKSLPSILRMVMDGERFLPYVGAKEGNGTPSSEKHSSTAMGENLLPIESQIIEFVAEGRTNKEIGWSLGITEILVKMHMRNLCKKLDAKNRAHAVMIARQLGLL